jgi:hypothetical protein
MNEARPQEALALHWFMHTTGSVHEKVAIELLAKEF